MIIPYCHRERSAAISDVWDATQQASARLVADCHVAPFLLTTMLVLLAMTPLVHAELSYAQQAELAWQSRDKPGQTEAAIRYWSEALQAEPKRADLWIALARAQGRAVRHASSDAEKKKWADSARVSADHAIRIDRQNAEAYTIYGEALGQWVNVHKGIHSLNMVHQAIEALEKALSIDPHHAYAHMLLSEIYRQAPRVLFVGDKKKALEHAQFAVQYGPTYSINHLALAHIDIDLGKKEEAIAELQKIMALSPPPEVIPETRADQQAAATLLHSMGVSPTPEPVPCGEVGNACVETP